MWLIFIVSCVIIALATLLVIYIGHKVMSKIKRENKISDLQWEELSKIYEERKEELKEYYREENKE